MDAHWTHMIHNLTGAIAESDPHTSDEMVTDIRCLYVEAVMLPPTAIITQRTQYEAKPRSERSSNTQV
jgi:hypothetical protein